MCTDFSHRTYKQSILGANFRSELEAVDGTHTQTESTPMSNDAAVNTGTVSPLSSFCSQLKFETSRYGEKIFLIVIFSAKPSRIPVRTSSRLSDEMPIEEFASGSLALVHSILSLSVRLNVLLFFPDEAKDFDSLI